MNLSLDNNVNKFVLLVVSGVIVLLVVNMNKKKLGNQVSTLVSVLVIVASGFFGYTLLNQENEQFNIEYQSVPPADKYVEDFMVQPTEEEDQGLGTGYNTYTNFDDLHTNAHKRLNQDDEWIPDEFFQRTEMPQFSNIDLGDPDVYVDNAVREVENPITQAQEVPLPGPIQPEPPAEQVSMFTNYEGFQDKPIDNNPLNSENLLPSSSSHSEINPSNNGGIVNESFLNAGHHVGINTQGCSLRNSNRGLRSEPPNRQTQVSPWLQTTITPDLNRKTLDGSD